MALDFPVGTDFPAEGNQIPDGHEYNGFYWDATEGVWRRICDGVRYLLAHGDDVLDCDDPVEYKWNESVSFERTGGDIEIDAPTDDSEKVNRTIDDTDDVKQITNKEYVDAQDNELRQDIIELEEEIDAIAPSVEYGTWEWQNPTSDNATRPPAAGTFFLVKDGPGGVADPVVTDQYLDTEVIVIHNDEYVPSGSTDPVDNHSWADADAGKLIQLFDAADPDFFLGEILSTVVESDHVRIRVTRIQSSGVPNDNADPLSGDFLTRVNIFNPPSGGTASEFVKVIGDTMTGQLKFYTEQADDSTNFSSPPNGSRDIRLTTKRLDTGFENSTSLFKPGYTDALVCSGALMSKQGLYTGSYLYGTNFKNDGTRVTKTPRIYFFRAVDSDDNVTDEYGALRWSGSNRLRWDDEKIEVYKPIKIDNNALATEGQHAIHRGYVDKVARMAGLQLGRYLYRRSTDTWVAGSMRSNTTTNPANITELSIYKNNHDGITFGASFLANLIVPGMFLHFMDKQEGIYCGKIEAVYNISNGITVTLTPFNSLISGGVYLNNPYDVLISYNRFGIKFPQ